MKDCTTLYISLYTNRIFTMRWPTKQELLDAGGVIIKKVEGERPYTATFRLVKAADAKRYDGLPARHDAPAGRKECIEKELIMDGKSTFTNKW